MLTSELKQVCEVFSKVIKNNPIRPITDLVQIVGNEMWMTDGITTIRANISEEIKGKCVVSLSKLYSITKLTTTENIELKVYKDYVSFKGNGSYKIPICVDSGGEEVIIATNLISNFPPTQTYSYEKLKELYERSKLAVNDLNEDLGAFYFTEDGVIATDSVVIAYNKCNKFIVDIIQPYVLEKLSYLGTDVNVGIEGDKILVNGDVFTLSIINNKVNFPIESVKPFIVPLTSQSLFENSFRVKKSDMVAAIKRQNVFKSAFSIPSIHLSITSGEVVITNKRKTVDEKLVCVDLENTNEVLAIISTDRLLNIIKVLEDDIKVYVGHDAVALEDSKGFYILGSMEEA